MTFMSVLISCDTIHGIIIASGIKLGEVEMFSTAKPFALQLEAQLSVNYSTAMA